jgi:hypothetical protein
MTARMSGAAHATTDQPQRRRTRGGAAVELVGRV